MKQLLVIAVALASVNAFATRARVNALGNSPHLIDTQTVYGNPADMFFVGGDYVTIETGKTAATGLNDGAEGMVVRSMGDAKMGLSLGHDSDVALQQRTSVMTAASAACPTCQNLFSSAVNKFQQNPIELTYGMKTGEIVLGIVYEVNRQECFYAWKNGGAWLNGQRIHCSATSGLADSLVATGFPYRDFDIIERRLS